MLKGLIAPVIAAVAAAVLAWTGARLETYNVDGVLHCSYGLARADLPPANVLFVGNSQTGAAIDPAYVADLIDPDGSVSVEKLTIVQGHIVALRMLVEDYVERRGAPEIVVLQPMVVRAEDWQQPAGRPIHTRANLAFQPWDDLAAVQTQARFSANAAGPPQWMQAGYRTLPAVFVDRIVEKITATLSYPRLARVRDDCQADMMFRQADIWPYRSFPLPDGARFKPIVSAAQRAQWKSDIAKRKPANPDNAERTFEIDQHRKLLAALRAAGSRVILVGYPNYSTAEQDARDHAAFGRALGQEVVDVHGTLSKDEQAALPALFRDPFHLSYPGGEIVSRRLAELVSEERS